MSRNKIALSFALAGILGASTALADEGVYFFGVQGGSGTSKYTLEATPSAKADFKGLRYGIVFGQKGFSTDYDFLGVRYYLMGDYGTYKYTDIETFEISTFNLSLNFDALLNFFSTDNFDLGVFAGVGLGYAYHKVPISEMMMSGVDVGVNLGLMGSFAQNHSIEFYTRFSFMEQELKSNGYNLYSGYSSFTEKVQQPFQAGLRYIYSF